MLIVDNSKRIFVNCRNEPYAYIRRNQFIRWRVDGLRRNMKKIVAGHRANSVLFSFSLLYFAYCFFRLLLLFIYFLYSFLVSLSLSCLFLIFFDLFFLSFPYIILFLHFISFIFIFISFFIFFISLFRWFLRYYFLNDILFPPFLCVSHFFIKMSWIVAKMLWFNTCVWK